MSDTNIPLPPDQMLEALGARVSQLAIEAASWQVAQQETQRRGAEQIASLTEAMGQRDQKVHAATRLIEELLAGAELNPEGVATVTKEFLVQFCHGHGFPVQLPDSSPTFAEPGSPAAVFSQNNPNDGPVADAGLDA